MIFDESGLLDKTDYSAWKLIFERYEIPQTRWSKISEGAPRILVLCQGGNSRSVAISMMLKYKFDVDAMSASIERNTDSTLEMLFDWADLIIITQEKFRENIRKPWMGNVVIMDIGHDRWANPMSIELLDIALSKITEQLSHLEAINKPRRVE